MPLAAAIPGPWWPYRHQVARELGAMLRPGDIIARLGNAKAFYFLPFSRIIKNITRSKYSHASLVLEVDGRDTQIADCNEYGMRRQWLIDWIDDVRGKDFVVLRYRGSQDVVDRAVTFGNRLVELDPGYSLDFSDRWSKHPISYEAVSLCQRIFQQPPAVYCVQMIYLCYRFAGAHLGSPDRLHKLPGWKCWMPMPARLFGLKPSQHVYHVGNRSRGLLSCSDLEVVARPRLKNYRK